MASAAEGAHPGRFRPIHWALLAGLSSVFGSAFLLISVALDSFAPTMVAFGRVTLGAAALATLPAARHRINRADYGWMVVIGITGHGGPALLFAFAEQRVPSATAGMLMSAIPITTTTIAALVARTVPSRRRIGGLAVGFVGVLLISWPELTGTGDLLGIALVCLAVVSYSVTAQLYGPMQHRYGAIPVTMWSLCCASVLLLPLGLTGLSSSSIELRPLLALVTLGVLGTGAARAAQVSLVGRVGAARTSIAGYLVPIVALILGIVVLDETIVAGQYAGIACALAGGFIVSRTSR